MATLITRGLGSGTSSTSAPVYITMPYYDLFWFDAVTQASATAGDLLGAIKVWFTNSSIASSYAGGLHLEEFPDDAAFPLVVLTDISESEPGDCIEQHPNTISVDIFASTAKASRTLGQTWHAAFLPNPSRSQFAFSDGTESTTLYNGSQGTYRRRIGAAGKQLWCHNRMYQIYVESTTYVEN